MNKQEECTEKECRRCHKVKPIEDFRKRPFGFTLNQCKDCESEMNKLRAQAKKNVPQTITTKSGVVITAYLKPIKNCRVAASPNTDKVLYFEPEVSRDHARLALSTYANITRTGITYQPA